MSKHISPYGLTAHYRAKIRTGMLLNRLNDFAAGRIEMSRGQVQAATVLLRKVLPDLSSTDLGTADGQPMRISIVKFNDLADDEKLTPDDENERRKLIDR